MPPTKRTTSRKPPARRTAARPAEPIAEEPQDDSIAAAKAQEIEAGGHYVTAALCDEDIQVVPPGAWRQSWHRMLKDGELDAFAELVVHPDDLELYFELDPTNDEFGEFIRDASGQSGESQGKSPGPNRSSRRTRRR